MTRPITEGYIASWENRYDTGSWTAEDSKAMRKRAKAKKPSRSLIWFCFGAITGAIGLYLWMLYEIYSKPVLPTVEGSENSQREEE